MKKKISILHNSAPNPVDSIRDESSSTKLNDITVEVTWKRDHEKENQTWSVGSFYHGSGIPRLLFATLFEVHVTINTLRSKQNQFTKAKNLSCGFLASTLHH